MRAGFHDNKFSLRETFQFIRREQCALCHLQALAVAVFAAAYGTGKDCSAAEGFRERLRRLAVWREAAEDRILAIIGYDLRALLAVILL